MAEYRALYRKWRPTTFDKVYGQKSVTDTLKFEVANQKISHAYLFCGSRGTGKTSCAKILAKAVNCLSPKGGNPCGECEACRAIDAGLSTDVIEMDAASNNGVDNVRVMKDEIAFTPAELKYRVYIIDEVHMMSGSAFNALLKTLEEPPAYVVFILATTEFNKLPTTIVSRCQRFDFRRIPSDVLCEHIFRIAEREGFTVTEGGARMIARAAQGGMRDTISLLELCASCGNVVDEVLVSSTVGAGNRENAYKVAAAIASSDYATVFGAVNESVMSGIDLSVFWNSLIDAYRDIAIYRSLPDAGRYLDLTDIEFQKLSEVSAAFTPARLAFHTSLLENALSDMLRAQSSKRAICELALTRMCDPKQSGDIDALLLRVEELEKQISMLRFCTPSAASESKKDKTCEAEEKSDVKSSESTPSVTKVKTEKPETDHVLPDKEEPYAAWPRVIEQIGEVKRALSVQFIGSHAYRRGDCSFRITMGDFFAKKLSGSEADLAILRGVIAETEGKNSAEIQLSIEGQNASFAKNDSDLYDF